MDKDIKNIEDYNSFLNFLLIKSAIESDCKLLNKIINNGGNVNFQTPNGLDLIMIGLAYGQPFDISNYISCLIENGIDLNHIDKYYGNNALQYASRYGANDVVKLLIENGADINSVNADGYNSLLNACESIPLFFPFYISEWNVEMPYTFYEKTRKIININYRSIEGRKRFKSEQLKTIKTLLENGIEKDILTGKGFSAMDLAILNNYFNNSKMVKLLKENNVKMNKKIIGTEGSLFDSLFYGGPGAFYSYCMEDNLIKRKIKEYNKK